MKEISARSWIIRFFAFAMAILLLLRTAVYVVDPFFQYRVRDNVYFLNGRFLSAGLIKNHEYDAVLIGSSMTWNFDMALFREKLSVNPIKVYMGGIRLEEIERMYQLLREQGKAEHFYICVDQYLFTHNYDSEVRFPEYLSDEKEWNDYRYYWGYEAWFRFMPVDAAYAILKMSGYELPPSIQKSMLIDKIGDQSSNYSYSSDTVIYDYLLGRTAGFQTPPSNDFDRLVTYADHFLNMLDFSNGDYVLFFPPYSALFWMSAEADGYADTYLKIKEYIFERLAPFDNVTIYDFQGDECTTDLNNYKDTTHYSAEVCEWIVDCFAKEEHKVSSAEMIGGREVIDQNIDVMLTRYPILKTALL